jgi:hypothetical protein
MKTKHLSLTLQETPSKMLCPPSSLQSPYILSEILPHLKDKNVELLSNLRCKKLSDFQWYKNTFLTRVMLREDSNQPFWKENFLAGLPILLGEKVRNKIKDTFTTKIIPYDQLTYGELVSFTQKEGLKICSSKVGNETYQARTW